MTAPLPHRATRRGTLVGTLAALALTGCDAIDPSPPAESGPGDADAGQSTDVPTDPDEELVAGVRADVARASVAVTSAVAARPDLRSELVPFVSLHSSHLRALDSDRPRGRRPVRGRAAEVRQEVLEQERRLQGSLAAAALSAESGPLAALLASMAAAVAQQLVVTVGS